MICRPYGKTGLNVSRLGYGAMRFPAKEGRADMDAACRVVRHAYELGINFFDSHHNYHDGLSEVVLGEALGDVRDRSVIQTKCPYYTAERRGDTYHDRLATALKKLKRTQVDVLLAHSVSRDPWERLGKSYLDFARSAKRQGLIGHLGFSSHADVDFVMQLIESGDFEVVLLPYNLLERRYQVCLGRAKELGLGTAVMNPVGGGRLGAPNPKLAAMIDRPIESTVELALRFAFANADIDVVLSGMTYPEWVTQNAALVGREPYLTAADQKKLRKVLAEKEALAQLYCTACRYCMPCPHGVDIPGNFYLMNMYRVYGLKAWARTQYRRLKATRAQETDHLRASACTQCRACEEKCPNQIPIAEQLKEVDRVLGGDADDPR